LQLQGLPALRQGHAQQSGVFPSSCKKTGPS
jgi:hypothetical protein